jgi:MFS family permease
MSCIPFGGHFVKNGMSSLEQMMLDDPEFPLTNTMYGALISAVSIPNMFIPLFGGRLMDQNAHRSIRFFLIWICIGQAIFTIGMQTHQFWLALLGRIFFGIGEGSVIVGARVFIAHWFLEQELTFAMGASVAVTNVSKMMGKATVVPVAMYFGGSYVNALWYGVVICILSVGVGLIVCLNTIRLKKLVKSYIAAGKIDQLERIWLKRYVDKTNVRLMQEIHENRLKKKIHLKVFKYFPMIFWTLAVLHVVFVNVFHLFQNVASSFLYQKYGYSLVKSGYVSSLSHLFVIFAPLIGLCIDLFGGRMILVLFSSLMSICAYALMIWSSISPVVSMLLISVCLSFTPTILIAAIPHTVNRNNFGTAFGIVEIIDATGATIGNLLIGYLRDQTGSYDVDIYILLGMACFCFLLTLFLLFEDQRAGQVLSGAHRRMGRHRSISMDDDYPVDNPIALGAESPIEEEQEQEQEQEQEEDSFNRTNSRSPHNYEGVVSFGTFINPVDTSAHSLPKATSHPELLV